MTGACRPATQLDILLWDFERELRRIINCHSIDSALNIPDWLLAQHVVWYMRNLRFLLMERKRMGMFIDEFDTDMDKDPYQIERERLIETTPPEPPREPEYVICKCCAGSQSVPNPMVSNTAYTTCPKCGGTGYEIKPGPAKEQFEVGDWVTDGVVTGKITGWGMGMAYVKCDDKRYHLDFANLRKLDPSEVRVTITLEGTVHKIDGNNLAFELEDEKGAVTCVGYQQLDPDTEKLVRELADK